MPLPKNKSLKAPAKHQVQTSGPEQYVQNISQQLLLRKDCQWGEILSAGPSALVMLGQSFVAASSASSTAVIRVEKSGRLESTSLRANLQHCGDLGQEAFLDAEARMERISMTASYICSNGGSVDKILKVCSNEKLAKLDLQSQLDRLRQFSKACVADAEATQRSFKDWAEFAQDLKRACVNQDDDTKTQHRKLEDEIAITEDDLESQKEDLKNSKAILDEAKLSVNLFAKDMAQAQAKVPNGWALTAMRAANGAMNGAGSVVSGTAALFSVASSLVGADSLLKISVNLGSKQPQASKPSMMEQTFSEDDREALKLVKQLRGALHSLMQSLCEGKSTDGVDWDVLLGNHIAIPGQFQTQNGKSIGHIHGFLTRPIELRGNGKSSLEANSLLLRGRGLSEQILRASNNKKTLTNKMVQNDSSLVQNWQDSVRQLCNEVQSLESSLSAHKEECKRIKEEEKAAKKATNHKRRGLSSLQTLRDNYTASQKALLESQKMFQEVANRDRRDKQKFNEIQLDLQRLASTDVTMKDTLEVLGKCIGNLTEFQNHLSTFRSFFQGLENMIKSIDSGYVQDFLNSAEKLAVAKQEEDVDDRRVLMKHYLECIKFEALQVRGSYAVAGEIAMTYTEVSKKHIIPGVYKVNQLMLTSNAMSTQLDVEEKVKMINSYAKKAQSQISKLADERRERLKEQLYATDRQVAEVGLLIDAAATLEADNTAGGDAGDQNEGEDDEASENGDQENDNTEDDEWDTWTAPANDASQSPSSFDFTAAVAVEDW